VVPDKRPAGAAEADLSLTMTRRFAAAPDEVFAAWTDPRRIGRWIGPRGVTAEATKLDARPGGAYCIAMTMPSGEIRTVRGVYREIRPPERLVFTWAWDGDDGKPGHESLVTLTFKPVGRETEMTLRQERFASREARDRHEHGWTGSFDKLAEALAVL